MSGSVGRDAKCPHLGWVCWLFATLSCSVVLGCSLSVVGPRVRAPQHRVKGSHHMLLSGQIVRRAVAATIGTAAILFGGAAVASAEPPPGPPPPPAPGCTAADLAD